MTAQTPERVIYDGKDCVLYSPSLILDLDGFSKLGLKKTPRGCGNYSTALYRGYRSTYEITENELKIKEVLGLMTEESKDVGKNDGSGMRLSEYSGTVVIRFERMLKEFKIENGYVKSESHWAKMWPWGIPKR